MQCARACHVLMHPPPLQEHGGRTMSIPEAEVSIHSFILFLFWSHICVTETMDLFGTKSRIEDQSYLLVKT